MPIVSTLSYLHIYAYSIYIYNIYGYSIYNYIYNIYGLLTAAAAAGPRPPLLLHGPGRRVPARRGHSAAGAALRRQSHGQMRISTLSTSVEM